MQELQIAIPKELSNMQLPDPQLRDFYRDEEQRTFVVNDEIDESLLDLVRMIIRCNQEDKGIPVNERKPIRVLVSSPGGDVVSLWTTIKAIEMSKTPVWTINFSYAYSAAAELVASGTKRFALPGTQFLVHSGSCQYGGTVEQAESMKKYFDKLSKKLNEHFIERTNVDPKVYKRKAPSDWYMDENEALEQGLIDEIITDYDEVF